MAGVVEGVVAIVGIINEVNSILEASTVSKKKCKALRRVLDVVKDKLEKKKVNKKTLHAIESDVEETQSMIQRLQPPSKGSPGMALWRLTTAKKFRAGLDEAGKNLRTSMTLLHFELLPEKGPEDIEEDEDDEGEAVAEIQNLRDKGVINDSVCQSLAKKIERGTDADYQSVMQTLAEIKDEAEVDISTDKVSINSPVEVLGRGQFGEVVGGVLADDQSDTNRQVAIKRIHVNTHSLQLEEQRALRDEAHVWRGLNHKNVVQMLGMCIINNHPNLVLERCDYSLETLIYDPFAPTLLPNDESTILRGVARGLAYLHSKGVIHRDLKPANILFCSYPGHVKLSDFGVATATLSGTSFAETRGRAGTPAYLSPEVQTHPARWSTRADIYALGVVIWEIHHRERPFQGSSQEEVREAVRSGDRPPISEDVAIKQFMLRLLRDCWKQEPHDRPRASQVLTRMEKGGMMKNRRSTRVIKAVIGLFKARSHGDIKVEVKEATILACLRDISRRQRHYAALLQLAGVLEEERRKCWEDYCKSERLQSFAREEGVVEELLSVVADDAEDRTTGAALLALGLALSGSGAEKARESVDCKSILDIMCSHPRSPEVCTGACRVLTSLACVNDKNKIILGQDLNAGKQILKAMEAHCDHAGVQRSACGAIAGLAYNDDKNRIILGQDLNAGKQILKAMEAHCDHAGVQEAACGAIGNLAVNAKNEIILGQDLNAGKQILKAMEAHCDHAGVQSAACAAIHFLAWNYEVRTVLRQIGAADKIDMAIRNHPSLEMAKKAQKQLNAWF